MDESTLIPWVPPPKSKVEPPVKLVVLFTGIPSTTYSGSELALMEVVQRTRMLIPQPDEPNLWVTCTPPALPCIDWVTLGNTSSSISLAPILDTAVGRVALFIVP